MQYINSKNNHLHKYERQAGISALALFGSVFLIVGLITGYFSLQPAVKSLSIYNWIATPAIVIDANLYQNTSDGTTTYMAEGRYKYDWNGRTYISDQLNFSSGSDNIDSYNHDLVKKLQDSQQGKGNLIAWVNPDNPSEAVIDKTIRWSKTLGLLLFSLIFGGAGAGIIIASRYSDKSKKRESERQQLHPTKPWLWRDEWQTSEIKSGSKSTFLFSVIFATFWCLMSSPVLFFITDEIFEKKNYLASIALLFPIVGVGLATWAVKNYLRWKRFKDSTFTLDRMPFYLGQQMQGTLSINERLPSNTQFNIKLSCIHKYTSGTGKNSSTKENIKWQDEQHIPIIAGSFSDKFYLPIQFNIPNNLPVSDWSNSRSKYLWRLSIESDIEGADFNQDFELPVFDSGLDKNQDKPISYKAELTNNKKSYVSNNQSNVYTYKGDWQKLDMVYEDNVTDKRYYFPAARHKGVVLMLSILGFVFGGFGIGVFLIEDGSFFFSAIFTLIGAAILFSALRLLFHRTETNVSRGQLKVRSGMFISKERIVPSEDIGLLSNKISFFAGKTQYYEINAETYTGEKIRIATQLKGKRDVEALMHKINDELGLAKNKAQ